LEHEGRCTIVPNPRLEAQQEPYQVAARLAGLHKHVEKVIALRVEQTTETLAWTKNKAKRYRYGRVPTLMASTSGAGAWT
jgi:hypothetical protein